MIHFSPTLNLACTCVWIFAFTLFVFASHLIVHAHTDTGTFADEVVNRDRPSHTYFHSHAVYTDGVKRHYYRDDQVLNILREHLFHNVVQLDGQFFLQMNGENLKFD